MAFEFGGASQSWTHALAPLASVGMLPMPYPPLLLLGDALRRAVSSAVAAPSSASGATTSTVDVFPAAELFTAVEHVLLSASRAKAAAAAATGAPLPSMLPDWVAPACLLLAALAMDHHVRLHSARAWDRRQQGFPPAWQLQQALQGLQQGLQAASGGGCVTTQQQQSLTDTATATAMLSALGLGGASEAAAAAGSSSSGGRAGAGDGVSSSGGGGGGGGGGEDEDDSGGDEYDDDDTTEAAEEGEAEESEGGEGEGGAGGDAMEYQTELRALEARLEVAVPRARAEMLVAALGEAADMVPVLQPLMSKHTPAEVIRALVWTHEAVR